MIQALKENADAAKIKLSSDDIAEVRRLAENAEASNDAPRYPEEVLPTLFADTPPLGGWKKN